MSKTELKYPRKELKDPRTELKDPLQGMHSLKVCIVFVCDHVILDNIIDTMILTV